MFPVRLGKAMAYVTVFQIQNFPDKFTLQEEN